MADYFSRRPKFISVAVWGVQFWERSTLSNWFNRCENCYNPVHAAHRRAEAPGYGMRSPPARTRADYFFKDHIMPIKIGIRSRNKIP